MTASSQHNTIKEQRDTERIVADFYIIKCLQAFLLDYKNLKDMIIWDFYLTFLVCISENQISRRLNILVEL